MQGWLRSRSADGWAGLHVQSSCHGCDVLLTGMQPPSCVDGARFMLASLPGGCTRLSVPMCDCPDGLRHATACAASACQIVSSLMEMYAGSYSPNEETAVSGWLALDPSSSSSQPEFGLAVSGIPDETGASWVASVGR